MRRLFHKEFKQHDQQNNSDNNMTPTSSITCARSGKLTSGGRLFQQVKSSLDSIRTVPSPPIKKVNSNTRIPTTSDTKRDNVVLSENLNQHYLRLQEAEKRLMALEEGSLWDEELKEMLKDVKPINVRFRDDPCFFTNPHSIKMIKIILADIDSIDDDINNKDIVDIMNGLVGDCEWNTFDNFSSVKLDEIIDYFTTVPQIRELPTRLSKFKISETEITNVTKQGKFDHLFQDMHRQNRSFEDNLEDHTISENSIKIIKNKVKQDSRRWSHQAIKIKDKTNILIKNKQRLSKDFSMMPLSPSMNFEPQNYTYQLENQKFIKYHLYQYRANSMILTTNPDIRHTYCKYAPSFEVEIFKKNINNFRLVVKDFYDMKKVIMVITKEDFRYYWNSVTRQTIFKDNNYQQIFEKEEDNKNNELSLSAGETSFFSNDIEMMSLIKKYDGKKIMNRYFLRDHKKRPWFIGSIPKLKNGNFIKLRDENNKITHKYDTYFFSQESASDFQVKLAEPFRNRNIENKNMILSCFRPYEKEFTKKFIKDLKRLKNEQLNQENNYIERDISKDCNLDNYGADIFFKPGDGITYKNPPDDSPDKFTVGWLTIYNEKCLEDEPMFELTLGMTLASAFEKILKINNYEEESYY